MHLIENAIPRIPISSHSSHVRDRTLAISVCLLTAIFLIAYSVPTKIVYPAHDYLDRFMMLKARAATQHFFALVFHRGKLRLAT